MLLDEYIHKKAPDRSLYHYTSIDALYSMCEEKENQEIWATNAAYMNDSQELLYAFTLFKQMLHKKVNDYSDEHKTYFKILEQYLSDSVELTSFIYVYSLSEECNSLSQWRSYTPHGKGVCLEYDMDTISGLTKDDGIHFVKCEYDTDKQNGIINELVEKLKDDYDRVISNFSGVVPPSHTNTTAYEDIDKVVKVLAVIKHPAFHLEKEWRVVVTFHAAKELDEKYRVGASMLTPYVPVKFNEGFFIKSIMIGPTAHASLSAAALSRYLDSKSLKPRDSAARIPVSSSNIPYREW